MKNSRWYDILLALGVFLSMAMPLPADTYVWDSSIDPGYQVGGDGIWSYGTAYWNIDGTGTTLVPWVDGNDAVFEANGPMTIYPYTVSASSITFNGTGYTLSGMSIGNNGDYVMNQDAVIASDLSGVLQVRGPGTLTITGSAYALNEGANILVANGAGIQGNVVQDNGEYGIVAANKAYVLIGGINQPGTGSYTLNSGILDYGYGLYLGWGVGSTGSFIQNGGEAYSSTPDQSQGLLLGLMGAVGNYHLNGGTLTSVLFPLSDYPPDPASQNFFFGGGTFKAMRAFNSWTGLNTTIESGATAIIDTNGANVSWNGLINGVGDNGLRKEGIGILTLGPANNFAGEVHAVNGVIKATGNTSLGSGLVTTHWDLTDPLAPVGGGVDLNGCTLANNFVLHGAGPAYTGEGAIFNTSATSAEITGSVVLGTEGQYLGGDSSAGNIKLSGLVSGGVDSGIGGIYAIFKNGNMTVTLNRPDNTFDGFIYIERGVLEVTKLANKNQPSSLGQPTTDASNVLKFSNFYGIHTQGQTLRYIGDTASSTDRSIVLSYVAASDNIFDASGTTPAATVTFTGDAVFTPSETLPSTTVTLTGENSGDNTFVGDIAGPVSLVKSEAGKWVLSGVKSYTGDTIVDGGELVADSIVNSPNVLVRSGTLTAGSIVADTLTIGAQQVNTAAVPEPSAIILLAVAGLSLLLCRRR